MFEEIKIEINNLKTDHKSLRVFSITIFFALLVFGGLLLYKGNHHGYWLLIASLIFILAGFFAPDFLRLIYVYWMGLAFIMSYFVSRIILAILFYGLFLPVGLGLKIFGKNLLRIKIEPDQSSYWSRKEVKGSSKGQYEKPF